MMEQKQKLEVPYPIQETQCPICECRDSPVMVCRCWANGGIVPCIWLTLHDVATECMSFVPKGKAVDKK